MRSDEILKRTQEGVKESNKILIEELIYDLENKGISPVISIDGETKKLQLIEGTELHNFCAELKKLGFEKIDFCLLSTDKNTENNVVVVVNKKSSKLREYKASKGSQWVADFHRDLESGFFDE